VVIDIDDDMRAMAQWAQDKCNARYAKSKRGNYTNLSADDRWYYGFLGELVFLKWLQHHYIQYRYEPEFTGRDVTDFRLYSLTSKQWANIDVKTASKSSHRYLMLPDAQLQSHPSEVYVGVRINDYYHGEVLGWCLKSDLKPVTDVVLPVPTSGLPFDQLKDITRLADQCKKIMEQKTWKQKHLF